MALVHFVYVQEQVPGCSGSMSTAATVVVHHPAAASQPLAHSDRTETFCSYTQLVCEARGRGCVGSCCCLGRVVRARLTVQSRGFIEDRRIHTVRAMYVMVTHGYCELERARNMRARERNTQLIRASFAVCTCCSQAQHNIQKIRATYVNLRLKLRAARSCFVSCALSLCVHRNGEIRALQAY